MLYTPRGIRIPVASVKGRCPRPLDDGGLRSGRPDLDFVALTKVANGWGLCQLLGAKFVGTKLKEVGAMGAVGTGFF